MSARATVALCYHRIGRPPHDPFDLAVTPENFAEHVDVITRRRPLALEELARQLRDRAVVPGGVVVTFDDGYLDNLVAAKPALERADVPATVFVTSGMTGTHDVFWWEELDDLVLTAPSSASAVTVEAAGAERTFRFDGPWGPLGGDIEIWTWLRELPRLQIDSVMKQLRAWRGRGPEALQVGDDLRFMNAAELRSLRAGGLIEVGAHTRTHPVLAALPADHQQAEIAGSRADLQEWLDAPVRGFAYPFGKHGPEYTPQSTALVREAGFEWGCAISPRPVTGGSRLHEIPRHVPPNIGGDAFEEWLDERLNPPHPLRQTAADLRARVVSRMRRSR